MKRLILMMVWFLLSMSAAHADAPRVSVIDVHGSLSSPVATWVTKQMDAAWKSGAAGIILDIDSDGGSMDAAKQIEAVVLARSADIPVAAYVHNAARGPASLIAVACKTLAMAPSGSLGGAPPDASKTDFEAAAEAGGRNPGYAAAFIAADTALPSVSVKPGDSLTLTTQQAQGVGYADVVAPDFPAVLTKMNLSGAALVPVQTQHLDAGGTVDQPALGDDFAAGPRSGPGRDGDADLALVGPGRHHRRRAGAADLCGPHHGRHGDLGGRRAVPGGCRAAAVRDTRVSPATESRRWPA